MENQGLTSAKVSELLNEYGFNELPSKVNLSAFKLFFTQVKNVFVLLLILAASLSFLVGDKIDGFLILAIVLLNTALGFYQEFKASKEIEALRKLEVLTSRVIRDGREQEISAKELVPQDLIILEAGDKIPADCKLVEAVDLSVNEAPLTGESLPVFKSAAKDDGLIYFGTTIVTGRGKALVLATGNNTRFGKIALSLAIVEEEPTPLEKTLADLAKKIALISILIAFLIFIIRFFQGFEILEILLTSIALMVAAVPEGLPAIVTIILAIGVHRMYKHKSLIRRMSAVESLGSTTIICTDKTGTLTKNEMHVKETKIDKALEDELLNAAIYCNSASLVLKENTSVTLSTSYGGFDILGDVTEGALLIWAKQKGIDLDAKKLEGKIIDELAFDLKRRRMTVVWQGKDRQIAYVKGAPEVILKLCKLDSKKIEKLTKEYEQMAKKGLRILGFAKKANPGEDPELNMEFLGFVGIADEAREEAKFAIERAKKAGIKVVMITGDNELTAKAIGEEVGLLSQGDEILTGAQLDEMDDEKLKMEIIKVKIFARVIPEHKLRIVQAFQSIGEVVAVTGDGVNDSLALKQAHVGVAMGTIGTDVAKEASDIIILDDNLATIVTAIEQGRLTYSNIIKVVKFLFAGNLSEVLVILVASLMSIPNPLLAVQILWVNFVTDGLPALALSADPASSNLMQIPPRDKDENLLSQDNLKFIVSGGVIIALVVLIGFIIGLILTNIEFARTVAFSLLVLSQMVFVFLMRKHHSIFSNKYLLASTLFVLIVQGLIVAYPPLQAVFKTSLSF